MSKINTYYPTVDQDPNEYILVRNSSEQLRDNFVMKELYNSRTGLSEHPLSVQVIDCLQAIRDYFGVPIRINSTYRNYIPLDGVDPANISPHMMGQAIDFSFIGDSQEVEALYLLIRDDFNQKGELFNILWDIGCRGFGSYDSFVHIDTTQSELYEPFRKKRRTSYQGALYARWNKMKVLRYKEVSDKPANPVTEAVDIVRGVVNGYVAEVMDGEDRGDDVNMKNGVILGAIIIVTLLLMGLPFLLYRFST
jgi:hypothetical protein